MKHERTNAIEGSKNSYELIGYDSWHGYMRTPSGEIAAVDADFAMNYKSPELTPESD